MMDLSVDKLIQLSLVLVIGLAVLWWIFSSLRRRIGKWLCGLDLDDGPNEAAREEARKALKSSYEELLRVYAEWGEALRIDGLLKLDEVISKHESLSDEQMAMIWEAAASGMEAIWRIVGLVEILPFGSDQLADKLRALPESDVSRDKVTILKRQQELSKLKNEMDNHPVPVSQSNRATAFKLLAFDWNKLEVVREAVLEGKLMPLKLVPAAGEDDKEPV